MPGGPRLSAALDGAEGAGRGVVVCHPHPHHGGTKDAAVVRLIADACAARGFLVLRFDFRGVGDSGGGDAVGPQAWDDAAAAVDALAERLPPGAPIGVAGYSFGAWVAAHEAARDDRVGAVALVCPGASLGGIPMPRDALRGRPALAVAAEEDHLTPPDEVARLLAAMGGGRVERVPGADHYLRGHGEDVAALVAQFLDEALPAPAEAAS
ncbi:MAG: alpha/beta fold hydrolase [Actinomycetota bacterium]